MTRRGSIDHSSRIEDLQNSATVSLAALPDDFCGRLAFPPFSVSAFFDEMFKRNHGGLRVNLTSEHFANSVGVCAQHLDDIRERCALLFENVCRYSFNLTQRLALVFNFVQMNARDRVYRDCHGRTSYGDAVCSSCDTLLRTTLCALISGAVTLAGSGTANLWPSTYNSLSQLPKNQPLTFVVHTNCCAFVITYNHILGAKRCIPLWINLCISLWADFKAAPKVAEFI